MEVYVTDVAAFLPHDPVDNDAIESVIGQVACLPAKAKRIVLKSNQIKRRHYAVDPVTGTLTHSNAALTAEAVRRLSPYDGFSPNDIACLCCGTSTPDVLLPGHALMVLGELGIGPCDAVTTAGICVAGMTAFRHAALTVAAGQAPNAVATGSELASSFLRTGFMTPCFSDLADLETKPARAFDADFLRWMLSDGAGAAFLSPRPTAGRISLKVEWIEHLSFAGRLTTCMYAGGVKDESGAVTGWRDVERIPAPERPYIFAIRQDIRLLDREIVATMGEALTAITGKHGLRASDVDWYLPHYSSAYFRPKFYEEMKRVGFEIPEERWFTNLPDKGNTGSAAIFIILEELLHSGRLEPGQRLLCFIPESGRFSHCFMLLTAVRG